MGKRRVVLDLKDRCSADEVCRIKIITNATNTTEANTTLVCTQPACDVEKAFEIKQRSDLYVTLGEGFVRDHFGNPSEGNTGLKERDPVCDCKSGTYVQTPCTDRIDVMCAACSTACPAGQYKVSECDTHSDIGCLPCRSCQTPYFVDGGCTGSTDTICSECTPCGPLEYEVSPCTGASTASVNPAKTIRSASKSRRCVKTRPRSAAQGELLLRQRRGPAALQPGHGGEHAHLEAQLASTGSSGGPCRRSRTASRSATR